MLRAPACSSASEAGHGGSHVDECLVDRNGLHIIGMGHQYGVELERQIRVSVQKQINEMRQFTLIYLPLKLVRYGEYGWTERSRLLQTAEIIINVSRR